MKSLTLYYGANYFLLKFTQETSSLIKHPVVFDGKVISVSDTNLLETTLYELTGYDFPLHFISSTVLNSPVHKS